MAESDVTAKWTELRTLVESLDVDVRKNALGNAAAGVRARKGLRLLKTTAHQLVKLSLENAKQDKAPAAS
jgi:hypothetical protein